MKGRTTISVNMDLIKEAQKKFLNVSELTERAIRDKLNKIEVEIDNPEELKCSICNKSGEKEIAQDVRSATNTKDDIINPNSLVWLYPDEIWICNSCLRRRVRHVSVAMK